MSTHVRKAPLIEAVGLDPASAERLSELALHYDQTLGQAALIAIHVAYLEHLEEKRRAAMQTLEALIGGGHDDEIPL